VSQVVAQLGDHFIEIATSAGSLHGLFQRVAWRRVGQGGQCGFALIQLAMQPFLRLSGMGKGGARLGALGGELLSAAAQREQWPQGFRLL